MNVSYLLLPLLGLLILAPVSAREEGAKRTYDQINSNVSPENVRYFEEYLSQCPKSEIRCLWFLENHIKVGMLMTLNFEKHTAYSVRHVYDWALQSQETRSISNTQENSAKAVVADLPQSADMIPFGAGLHISFWQNNALRTVTYDRSAVPASVQRLYDIGGGPIVCSYSK